MPAIDERILEGDTLAVLLTSPTAVTPEDSSVQAQLLWRCFDDLGEGIVWDERTSSLLWTDINGCRLHKLDLKNGRASTYEVSRCVGSLGLLSTAGTAESLPLLLAWKDGFQLYDLEKEKALSEMSTGEPVNPEKGKTRLNDGRVDPTGCRFVCGGYYGTQGSNDSLCVSTVKRWISNALSLALSLLESGV